MKRKRRAVLCPLQWELSTDCTTVSSAVESPAAVSWLEPEVIVDVEEQTSRTDRQGQYG